MIYVLSPNLHAPMRYCWCKKIQGRHRRAKSSEQLHVGRIRRKDTLRKKEVIGLYVVVEPIIQPSTKLGLNYFPHVRRPLTPSKTRKLRNSKPLPNRLVTNLPLALGRKHLMSTNYRYAPEKITIHRTGCTSLTMHR